MSIDVPNQLLRDGAATVRTCFDAMGWNTDGVTNKLWSELEFSVPELIGLRL